MPPILPSISPATLQRAPHTDVFKESLLSMITKEMGHTVSETLHIFSIYNFELFI